MEKENIEIIILRHIDFHGNVIPNGYVISKFGVENKIECYSKLKEMKESGLIYYTEDDKEYKGKPVGKIIITEKGRKYLQNNK